MNFYNEFDPHAAAWLRELIARKLIPAGVVDERSITDIQPHELTAYTQCHFFAGIAGWPLALELAGVDPTRPLWTGSCPCQPYSTAGKGLGDDDPRNLWPAFFKLIRECRPELVFGEQVADAIGKGWLDRVSADLEGEGYACGAAVLGAHSVNAPHIRKRLYWVADAKHEQREGVLPRPGDDPSEEGRGPTAEPSGHRSTRRLADANCVRPTGECREGKNGAAECGATGWVGNTALQQCGGSREPQTSDRRAIADRRSNSWSDSRWIYCRDGKHRRIPAQPALFPLADGIPYKLARRGSIRPALLKGAGNAIVPQTAAQFIQAFNSLTP